MPRFDVTTIGEGQLRYSVPAGVRLSQAKTLDVNFTGTEANVVGLLSRLGHRAGWISALPCTPLGQRVESELISAGVDLSAVIWSDQHRLASYYVEYALPPRASQVFYDRKDSCFTKLTLEQIDWDYLLDTRLLHISGLTLPLSSTIADILYIGVMKAQEAGIPISFDMNYRSRLWSPEEAASIVEPLLNHIDVLFFPKRDAQIMFKFEGTPEETLRMLVQKSFAESIVMSNGADGIYGWRAGTIYTVPTRQVTILDRIGAGDAMVAGVLHGYLNGSFEKGLRYGALTGALALSQYGDQIITSREEVEKLLESEEGDIVR